jgi:hypothetical protein
MTANILDPYFLSIPDPGSRIPDPKTATKDRGEKQLLSYLFLWKIEIILILNWRRKKFGQIHK